MGENKEEIAMELLEGMRKEDAEEESKEIPIPIPIPPKEELNMVQPMQINSEEDLFGKEKLCIYYNNFFPYKEMTLWLSYFSPKETQGELSYIDYFQRRELSFTLENDIYCRYLSFKDGNEFKKALVDRVPFKIDIGAVFNIPPKFHNSMAAGSTKVLVALEKELVFDIDMTDYDDVRTCCSGATVCAKCWKFVSSAIKVVDIALREDFGFEQLLWIYSGRRGVHCWVGDVRARILKNDQRSAILDYLSLNLGNENSGYKLGMKDPMHPSLSRAYDILKNLFIEVAKEQSFFEGDSSRKRLFSFLSKDLRNKLEDICKEEKRETTGAIWNAFCKLCSKTLGESKHTRKVPGNSDELGFPIKYREEVVFSHLYPRLDVNVSKQVNHLLKSPFCVHPKTGRICVPIDPNNIDNFDPLEVPTLSQIINEYNSKGKEEGDKPKYEYTSLGEYMKIFKRFLVKLLDHMKSVKRADSEFQQAAKEFEQQTDLF